MRKFTIVSITFLVSIFILVAGCSKQNTEHAETVKAYLKQEFTGPSDELINALEQDGANPPELKTYVEETYTPLVADLEQFVNQNLTLIFLRTAYENGYHLEPTSIDIQKIDEIKEEAYNFEVEVEYKKDDTASTATVTGIINMNDNGKISIIRNMDDGKLLEKMRN